MSIYTSVATSAGRDTRAISSDGKLDVHLALQKELGGDGEGTNQRHPWQHPMQLIIEK